MALASDPVCGNSAVEAGEECEAGDLNAKTCIAEGLAGGTLDCAAGCAFGTSGCYATRFDASGPTIVDHQTGLEWEKKDSAGGGESQWGTAATGVRGVLRRATRSANLRSTKRLSE